MKLITLHYAKDNKEVHLNSKFIISFETYSTTDITYTEVITLTDQCYDVKETPQEIKNLIECNDNNQYYVTSISSNHIKNPPNGTFKPPKPWKQKTYKKRSKKQIGL